jgi:succinate dehydrogenase/fumarate reductase flavoprotein subunit
VGLPGVIAVDRHGRRFVNEGNSYHHFGAALRAANDGEADVYGFLVCDARVMHRYGLGFAKPWPNLRIGYRRSGYLIVGRTLEHLARKAGIDPVRLAQTVEEFNGHARRGEDPRFGRGTTLFNRFKGDASHKPNPSLGPLERGPFYATKVRLGDIGSYAGLATDDRARVLDGDNAPVAGLYAVGTAAASVFGGAYPGHGAVLGPSMTFGFIAGRDIAASERFPVAASREAGRAG